MLECLIFNKAPQVKKLAKSVLDLWVSISRNKTAMREKHLCDTQA